MRRYTIAYERDAAKALRAIRDRRLSTPLRAAIEDLARNPGPEGCKKLTGRKDEWRVRVGDWRIVYRIEDERLVVVVVAVAPRGGVYG